VSVAAYYIHEKVGGSPEFDWISAVRQLRRAAVHASRLRDE
jgi:hypothetical protein